MKVLSSGVSVCLLAAMATLSVYPLPKVLAQDVQLVSQASICVGTTAGFNP